MCKYCKPLRECPVGEKRKSLLYGWRNDCLEMVLNRYETHSIGILHAEYDVGEFWMNLPVHIRYCPVCGEKLADNILLEDDDGV